MGGSSPELTNAGPALFRIGFSFAGRTGRVLHYYRGPEHVELHTELVDKRWHIYGTRYMPGDAPAELRALDMGKDSVR